MVKSLLIIIGSTQQITQGHVWIFYTELKWDVKQKNEINKVGKMGRLTGLEPATTGITIRASPN